jgi:hypothetical protein
MDMAHPKPDSRVTDDAALEKATGKDWNYWFNILNDMNLQAKEPTLVENILSDVYGLSENWSQRVTGRFERERGLQVSS